MCVHATERNSWQECFSASLCSLNCDEAKKLERRKLFAEANELQHGRNLTERFEIWNEARYQELTRERRLGGKELNLFESPG